MQKYQTPLGDLGQLAPTMHHAPPCIQLRNPGPRAHPTRLSEVSVARREDRRVSRGAVELYEDGGRVGVLGEQLLALFEEGGVGGAGGGEGFGVEGGLGGDPGCSHLVPENDCLGADWMEGMRLFGGRGRGRVVRQVGGLRDDVINVLRNAELGK